MQEDGKEKKGGIIAGATPAFELAWHPRSLSKQGNSFLGFLPSSGASITHVQSGKTFHQSVSSEIEPVLLPQCAQRVRKSSIYSIALGLSILAAAALPTS
jgi:hypothetical protein